uniref:Uncharacterized protein n=1 Tax=Anguilla anguilla TaxID=7936 RepID=A0A0E9QIP9_ANGAN
MHGKFAVSVMSELFRTSHPEELLC